MSTNKLKIQFTFVFRKAIFAFYSRSDFLFLQRKPERHFTQQFLSKLKYGNGTKSDNCECAKKEKRSDFFVEFDPNAKIFMPKKAKLIVENQGFALCTHYSQEKRFCRNAQEHFLYNNF